MRVISGNSKGKRLKAVPGNTTRPTSDKVKESMFNIIGPYFDGGVVLDLFAGTGALGIEALSRGMDQVVFIDADRKSVEVIRNNLETTGYLQEAEVYRNEAGRALRALAKRKKQFDLVFIDPPYRLKIATKMVNQLKEQDLLTEQAQIVVEHDAADRFESSEESFRMVRTMIYGDTGITIYGK